VVRAYVGSFLSLAGLTCALTWVYLAMRSVMEVGGACAEGGPYVIAQPCPKGVEVTMLGGIFGGLICAALFAWFASKLGGGYAGIVLLAWPALFLSLGWNFWEFGLDQPGEAEGLEWGFIVCGVIFWLMGGLPLFALAAPGVLRGLFWPRDRDRDASGRPRSPIVPDAVRSAVRRPSRRSPDRDFAGINRPQPAARPASAPPKSRAPAADGDVVARLERLAALRDRGALDADEYERAKKAVLDG
jgi:Short C-terminal domain